jgi:hypothetical protein
MGIKKKKNRHRTTMALVYFLFQHRSRWRWGTHNQSKYLTSFISTRGPKANKKHEGLYGSIGVTSMIPRAHSVLKAPSSNKKIMVKKVEAPISGAVGVPPHCPIQPNGCTWTSRNSMKNMPHTDGGPYKKFLRVDEVTWGDFPWAWRERKLDWGIAVNTQSWEMCL